MSYLYHIAIYQPLYNGLIFLTKILPWADAGIAIIVLTVIVKLILFPLSKKSVVTQLKMKKVEPQVAAIKEKYSDKQEQARQMMDLYKREGVNPFSGIILIIIQLPIIFALYKVFLSSGLPAVNHTLLYQSLRVSGDVNTIFLGLIDIAHRNLVLALIAGVSTFIQIRLAMPPAPAKKQTGAAPSLKDDLARSMNMQMRYMFPVLAFFISWSISGAIALYWITSNLFTIAQEIYIRKSVRSKFDQPAA